MKQFKKKGVMSVCLLLVLCLAMFAFTACEKEKTALNAPVIKISENVVTWEAVANATSYTVKVNDVEYKVKELSHTITETAVGKYVISVIATTDRAEFTNSAASNSVEFEIKAVPTELLVTAPTKTVYYLDERIAALDLAGATAEVKYSNDVKTSVELSKCVVGELDFSTVGAKEATVTYAIDGIDLSATINVTVEKRDINNVKDATEFISEYNAAATTKYKIADGAVTGVFDMSGKAVTTEFANGITTISNTEFGDEYIKGLRVEATDKITFVKAIRATTITDVAGFKAINSRLNGYFILGNSLDFDSSYPNSVRIGEAPISPDTEGFKIDLDGVGESIIGKAFNGVFDGKGYCLMNYIQGSDVNHTPTAYGLSVFGWIGKTGAVRNLTLRNVSISGEQCCAILSAFNEGKIENIVVEKSSSLFVHYAIGGLTAINKGSISAVNSFMTEFSDRNTDAKQAFVASNNTDKVAEKFFVSAEKTSIAELITIDGWKFIDGVGTVYVNDDYVIITDEGVKTIAKGGSVVLSIHMVNEEKINFASWGVSPDLLTLTKVNNQWTLSFKPNADLSGVADNATFNLAVYSTGWKTISLLSMKVTAAA